MESGELDEERIRLTGGRSTQSVIRTGNAVHRTLPGNYSFSHKLLLHLEQNGFHEAPKFLGISDENQEVLSYIDGDVPMGVKLTPGQVSQCIKMLRRLHDAASTFDLLNDSETICHNDFSPWNVIFKNDKPVGIIDFDDCKPGSRIEDVAYFLWTFLDLGIAEESHESQIKLIGALCRDYGLSNWSDLPEAILFQQIRILKFRRNIVATEKDEDKRKFSAHKIREIERSIDWVRENRQNIQQELTRRMI